MDLVYSDQVPTEPGWYWERRGLKGEERIICLTSPKFGWVRHWKEMKAETINTIKTLPEFTAEQAKTIESHPDSYWIIEWAGPIPHPK